MNIKELFVKYRHLILYVVFGVLTTLVNIVSYYICAHLLELNTVPSTIIAWILAVLFAYVTNRKWVFESEVKEKKGVVFEIIKFYLCRAATGVLDVVLMYVFVDVMHMSDMVIKIGSNILVIILNYVFSKLIVFKKKSL